MNKEQKVVVRDKLVQFVGNFGYTVDLNVPTSDKEDEKGPAGYCNYNDNRIAIREGKGIDGQISTLIHEGSHALGLGGDSYYSALGNSYVELACESITQYVTQAIGIERTHKTGSRVVSYGYKGFLATPVVQAYVNLFTDALDVPRVIIKPIQFTFKPISDTLEKVESELVTAGV